MTSWVNSERPAGRADERMGWCDHSAAFILPGHSGRQIWMARRSVSLILYLGQLQHTFPPHNNLCSKRTPIKSGLFIYQMFSSIFSQTSFCPKSDAAWWFTKPRSLLMKYSVCAGLWQTFIKNLNVLFWCVFLKWQKQTGETGTQILERNGETGNDPPMRGAFPRVGFLSPLSHSYAAITLECVTMISTSRYAWGQTWFWLYAGNVRKAHTGKLCSRLSVRFGKLVQKICIYQILTL